MISTLIRTTAVLALTFLVVDGIPPAAADDSFAKATLSSASTATSQDPGTTAKPRHTHGILRRQAQSVVAYVAPDNTVGFVDGRVGATVLCRGSSCIASAGIIGGCYAGNDCTYSGFCVDDAAYSTSSACPYGCEVDPNTVKCTYPGPEFCQPHTVPALSAIMYTCAISLVPTVTVETNPAGQSPARAWNTRFDNPVAESTAISGQTSTASSRSTSTTGSFSTATSTSTSTASSTGSSSSSESAGLSMKTIIGIAVGGFLVIAAVVGGVWYCRRNKHRNQIAYHQQPSVGYTYPTPAPFVPTPHPHGWQPPKPMDGRPHMAPQNYGHMQDYSGNHGTSNPVSPISNSPPPMATRYEMGSSNRAPFMAGRYEMGSSNRPPTNVAELGSGR